jgi:hypothetical protein
MAFSKRGERRDFPPFPDEDALRRFEVGAQRLLQRGPTPSALATLVKMAQFRIAIDCPSCAGSWCAARSRSPIDRRGAHGMRHVSGAHLSVMPIPDRAGHSSPQFDQGLVETTAKAVSCA